MSPRGYRRSAESPTTTLELFYDLVFVFAVTQVSHLLLAHLTWVGAGEAILVLLVVWWSWNYTTWFTNELDPDAASVRVVLIALMLSSLLMAVAIPRAFSGEALLFAGAYVFIQVGRTAFLAFAAAEARSIARTRAARILAWFVASGVLWILGALLGGPERPALWIAALALDYAAPLVTYNVPGLPRLAEAAWTLTARHFTERFGLFVIIALGESIVLIGATTSGLPLNAATIVAFALAFLETAALWWLYFNTVAGMIERRLAAARNPIRLARDAFTYLHVAIVAGVIVSAVGQEVVIAHPTVELSGGRLFVFVTGPALYLLAHCALRLRMTGTVSTKRLAGAAGCIAVGLLAAIVPALASAGLTAGVLLAIIGTEELTGAQRRSRGEPSPQERFDASRDPYS